MSLVTDTEFLYISVLKCLKLISYPVHRMLFDSRTRQCIGPCAPSFAMLPPAAPYAPLQSLHLRQAASHPRCPVRGRNLPHPLHRLPIAPPPPIPCSANCANVRRQRHSPRGRRTKVVPSSQPGAAAHETSNLTALLLSRLLSVRRRPAVLLGGTLPGQQICDQADPKASPLRRPLTGTGAEPSPGPQVQIPGIPPNRTAAAVHNERVCALMDCH